MRCEIIQWIIQWRTDSGKPAGRLADKHLSHCPACRQRLQAQQNLAHALHREAQDQPVPSDLSARVLATLATRKASPQVVHFPSQAHTIRRVSLAAACVLALIGTAFLMNQKHAKPTLGPDNTAAKTNALATDLIPTIAPERSVQLVQELAVASYRHEWQNLTQNAQAIVESVLDPIPSEMRPSFRTTPASNQSGER